MPTFYISNKRKVMIIYGIGKTHLGHAILENEICENCKEKQSLILNVFGKHIHIFWIPLFPISKKVYSQCSHCKKVLEYEEMPKTIKMKCEILKKKAKFEIWQYAGVFITIIFFALVTWASFFR